MADLELNDYLYYLFVILTNLISWLADLLADLLTALPMNWLADWLNDLLTDSVTERLIDWLRLAYWVMDLTGFLTY